MPTHAVITVLPDGPLQVAGASEIVGPDGAPINVADEVFLCRCGRSANKPLCDGSHARTSWTEEAPWQEPTTSPGRS